MLEVTLEKARLPDFLRVLAEGRRLIAPVAGRRGVEYAEVRDPSLVVLDAGNSVLSPKGAVFPQTEVLLYFEGAQAREAALPEEEVVLFGVRPCDARALTLLDKVFTWEDLRDPYYLRRRERTTVVTLACSAPGPACFCTSVGGSPGGDAGADVLAFDLGGRFLLRGCTERGEKLLRAAGKLTGKAAAKDREAAEAVAAKAAAEMERVEVPQDLDFLDKAFDAPLWRELSLPCLGCGVCAYSCPTCHCFDVTDEARKGEGRRVRSWDTCAFPLFTRHGSGHNPRSEKPARLRQRVLHKFLYCPRNFGAIFCVGCGRCVTNCPAGLDLREVLAALAAPAPAT